MSHDKIKVIDFEKYGPTVVVRDWSLADEFDDYLDESFFAPVTFRVTETEQDGYMREFFFGKLADMTKTQQLVTAFLKSRMQPK